MVRHRPYTVIPVKKPFRIVYTVFYDRKVPCQSRKLAKSITVNWGLSRNYPNCLQDRLELTECHESTTAWRSTSPPGLNATTQTLSSPTTSRSVHRACPATYTDLNICGGLCRYLN